MIKKVSNSKRLQIIRVLLRCGLPPSDLLTVYFSLVRSMFEYACSVLHNTLQLYLSDIEKVHRRAFRMIYPDDGYTDSLSIAKCKLVFNTPLDICKQSFKKIQDPYVKLTDLKI